jgi:hydroxyacylglutathione hydrolase
MLHRYFDDGLAQASFLLGCDRTREAVVIDPRRDVEVYVEAARQHGLRLSAAIETHVHADFVSGSRELAAIGVRTIGGPGSALECDHHEASDGERVQLGDLSLQFLHTPGHTPEHISILAHHPGEPARVFAGDTLFVGAVGRPDLVGADMTRQLAGELYDSLFGKLLALDGATEVHPGHGAGSLCGAGIGGEPHSTIGQERRFNPMLQYKSRETFVAAVLADLPDTPPYFARMKRVNREGPAVLGLATPFEGVPALPAGRAAAAANDGALLVDVRGADLFCLAHPTGAINIGFGTKVGYYAGWVLPAGTPIVLVAQGAREATEAARQLLRVGLDEVAGYVDGGFEAWRGAGLPVSRIAQMSAVDLRARLAAAAPVTVLDVRGPGEWRGGHIDGALHIPFGDLPSRVASMPTTAPVAAICESGFRSSLAASLLSRAGFMNVVNVSDGMAAYRALETTS